MKKTFFSTMIIAFIFLIGMLPLFVDVMALSVILSAFIFTYYTSKEGWVKGFLVLLILFGTAFVVKGIYAAAIFGVMLIPFLLVGNLIFNRRSIGQILTVGTLSEAIILGLYTKHLSVSAGVEPYELLFGKNIAESVDFLKEAGQMDAELMKNMQVALDAMTDVLQTMLPFFFVLISLVYIYIVFTCVRFLLKKQGIDMECFPYFHELWLPTSVSNIFIILFIFTLFAENSPVLINVVAIMFVLHIFCGLAVICSFLRRKSIPSGVQVIICAFILVLSSFFGGIVSSILCCLGMSSASRSIRK